jgi:hypothetical protein
MRAVVPTVVPSERVPDPESQPRLNFDWDRVHIVVERTEPDIVVDALRSSSSDRNGPRASSKPRDC